MKKRANKGLNGAIAIIGEDTSAVSPAEIESALRGVLGTDEITVARDVTKLSENWISVTCRFNGDEYQTSVLMGQSTSLLVAIDVSFIIGELCGTKFKGDNIGRWKKVV